MNTLITNRLILRQWKEEDLPQFVELNADPEVMKYFPSVLSEKDSNILAEKIRSRIEKNGWGFWAMNRKQISLSSALLD